MVGSMPAAESFSRSVGHGHRLLQRGEQPVDDRLRRAGGRHHALPDAEIEAREGLGDGRDLRRERQPLVRSISPRILTFLSR